MNDVLTVALAYAAKGWPVLPIVQGSKLPSTKHGVNDASTDPDQIRAWFEHSPHLNVAIAAGERSGLVVFDIDPRNGGDVTWEQWTEQNGLGIANTAPMQMTAGGGAHYLAQWQPEIKSCKLGEGLDLLSDGRYFLAYPSTIEGRHYDWEVSADPLDGHEIPPVPKDWLAAIVGRKKEAAPGVSDKLISGGRNNALTQLAGWMRTKGMTEAEILGALSVANETRCDIPLPASEVKAIARSVASYEPENDLAVEVALGEEMAERFLAGLKSNAGGFFLTRGSALIAQPAPLPWLIKKWVPAGCTGMVYGPSGVGKTFVVLDMACCVATGREWLGHKVKEGVVVYLAGEGNYGLRQRLASWCVRNDEYNLDRLLVSNRPIDLDQPGAEAEILRAVRELTNEPVALIVVDTLNRHMAGDENSAQQTRALINACTIVAVSSGAAVLFVHHTGHGEGAQDRERGSTNLRASMDVSINVKKDGDGLKVRCIKMKDAPEPDDIAGKIEPVDVGWVDEDGLPSLGAVFVQGEAGQGKEPLPDGVELDRKEVYYRKTFENAWVYGGKRWTDDGWPVADKAAMTQALSEVPSIGSERSIKNHLSTGYKDKTVGYLVSEGKMDRRGDDFVLTCEYTRNAFRMVFGL